MVDQFGDAAEGGFFFTGKDHEKLLVRAKEAQDGATPSGNSMAALALLRLSHLTASPDLEERAVSTLTQWRLLMAELPLAAGQMLVALDFWLGPVEEFGVVADRSNPDRAEALRLIARPFRPRKVVALRDTQAPAADLAAAEKAIPWLAGKSAPPGDVATYICQRFTCQAPLIGLEALRKQLDGGMKTQYYK
jgi:uncharacterized protein YyaL (SSP411 family)